MSQALVPAIVLPVRNGGPWLRQAVASLLAQTHADFELVVVDDHSTDGAPSQLPADSRVGVIANAGHGLVDALNTGWRYSSAAFIARMDADDIAFPRRLERQLDFLRQRPEVDLVAGQVSMFREEGPLGGGMRRYQHWVNGLIEHRSIVQSLFIENPMPHPTWLLRRRLLEGLGGYRDPGWSEDYDLVLRAWEQGARMGKPRGRLLRWRDHGARVTRRDPRCGPAAFRRCKAHFLARTLLRERSALIWGAGPTGLKTCDALREQGVSVQGFVDVDPAKIGRRRRDLPVIGPEDLRPEPDWVLLGAVGTAGVRGRIGRWLLERGYRPGRDFVFVA